MVPGDRSVLDHQPVAPLVLLRLHQDPLALETLAVKGDLVLVLAVLEQVVGALVPDRHRAGAVPVRDDAREVEVFDGVVLGVDGEPAFAALQRRALRYRPRGEDAAHLEPDIPVQTRRVMPVHHVAAGGAPPSARGPPPRRAASVRVVSVVLCAAPY